VTLQAKNELKLREVKKKFGFFLHSYYNDAISYRICMNIHHCCC